MPIQFKRLVAPFSIASIAAGTTLLFSTLTLPAQAQLNVYPLSTRAFFVTGCLSDEPPDYANNPNEAYLKTRICLCLLEKFQEAYTHEEFIALFEGVGAREPDRVAEAESFAQQNLPDCI